MAALGWGLGGEVWAGGSGEDSWGARPAVVEGGWGSRAGGWVTSYSPPSKGGAVRHVPGLMEGRVVSEATLAGIDGATTDSGRREWEALVRAGNSRESQSSLLGVFESLAGEIGLGGMPVSDPLGVTLDLSRGGPIVLNAGAPGQVVSLWLRNDGAALDLGGLDLKIGITGGGLPAPAITGVNLRAGDLFTSANSVQGGDPANTPLTQFWSVSVNDPFAPAALPGSGAVTLVGSLTLSTVGVSAGEWSLSLFGSETALLGPFGDSVPMGLVGGTLMVVPEIGWMPLCSGVALAVWGLWRRTSPGGPPGRRAFFRDPNG